VAIASGVLGSYENSSIVVTLSYNDANGAVSSVTVANNSAKALWFRVWLRADPGGRGDRPCRRHPDVHEPGR
jgi:hypothetical protein